MSRRVYLITDDVVFAEIFTIQLSKLHVSTEVIRSFSKYRTLVVLAHYPIIIDVAYPTTKCTDLLDVIAHQQLFNHNDILLAVSSLDELIWDLLNRYSFIKAVLLKPIRFAELENFVDTFCNHD
jgi:hypothetical protein